MLNYTHSHLWINSRYLLIKDIVDKKVEEKSTFETETFSFIRQWASQQQEFTIQTSGSTGTPKSITVTREQMIASAKRTATVLKLHNNHHALVSLSTKYIAGMMMLVRC